MYQKLFTGNSSSIAKKETQKLSILRKNGMKENTIFVVLDSDKNYIYSFYIPI